MKSNPTRIDVSVIAREPELRASKNTRRRSPIGLVFFVSVWLVVTIGMLWFYYEHVSLNREATEEIQFLFGHLATTDEEKRIQDQAIAEYIRRSIETEHIKAFLSNNSDIFRYAPWLLSLADPAETIHRNLRFDPVVDRFSTKVHLKSPRPQEAQYIIRWYYHFHSSNLGTSKIRNEFDLNNRIDIYHNSRVAIGAIAREYAEAISTIVEKIESDDRRAGVDRERREAIVDRTNREIPLENFRRDLFDKKKKMIMRLYPEQSIRHDDIKLAESIRARRSYEQARRTEPRNSVLLQELLTQWMRAENELKRFDRERVEAAIAYGEVDADDFERLGEHIKKIKDIIDRSQAELLAPSSGSTPNSREMIARRGRIALDHLDRIERERVKWIKPLKVWIEENRSSFIIEGYSSEMRDPSRLERLQALEGPALGSLIVLATVLAFDRRLRFR